MEKTVKNMQIEQSKTSRTTVKKVKHRPQLDPKNKHSKQVEKSRNRQKSKTNQQKHQNQKTTRTNINKHAKNKSTTRKSQKHIEKP